VKVRGAAIKVVVAMILVLANLPLRKCINSRLLISL
jgi:hypothetical protein